MWAVHKGVEVPTPNQPKCFPHLPIQSPRTFPDHTPTGIKECAIHSMPIPIRGNLMATLVGQPIRVGDYLTRGCAALSIQSGLLLNGPDGLNHLHRKAERGHR